MPQLSRENNHFWKGGKRFNYAGYIQIYKPEHPYSCFSYIFEHRLIIEKHLGRFLKPEEHCHHIDGNKLNNEPENLRIIGSN